MNLATVLSAILTLLAGVGVFLIACQMMSNNLESLGSSKLKSMFSSVSRNKLAGVGIGALGAATIHSSGAVSVMIIGFVNAGIMSLTQAATMIFGANIGTTITAQIIALGMFGSGPITTTVLFSACAGVGAFMSLFCKKESLVKTGGVLAGFGTLFVALNIMSTSMAEFAQQDSVKVFLATISNPILLVLIGLLFTAILQSSTVITSIAIAMVFTGLINLDQGIYMTMGSNIGSCVVAMIAGLTSGKNAKRTALIHLFFNVSGVVIFMLIALLMNIFSSGTVSFGTIFDKLFPGVPQTQLAMFHTFFNVVTVVIMLPLTSALVSLVVNLVPEDSGDMLEKKGPHVYYIDEKMLLTPPVAVLQAKNEIINMAEIARGNFNLSLNILTKLDLSRKDTFAANEEEINFLNHELVSFIVKLSNSSLSNHDHNFVSSAIKVISDIERIGDYAENIVEYAELLGESGARLSQVAIVEIEGVRDLVEHLYQEAIKAFTDEDFDALARANEIEDRIDIYTKAMENNHLNRLADGVCHPEAGAQYISLASNVERIADHLINVAKSIGR
ncbi:MAG: Na/Pi cotransporter family protein, partial [Bacteroidales bacterium]|nr:Na/Pi cotransporter family protein [Bacteroidales bacterium]